MAYTITHISQAVKNSERVNIYLNGAFWIGLHKNDLISHGLSQGRILSEEEKKRLEKVSTDGKTYEAVLRFVSLHPRSTAEVSDYLIYRKRLSSEAADSLIKQLQDKKLLSDEQFAAWYVAQKMHTHKNGVNKIKMGLMQKKVPKQIIEQVLISVTTERDYANEQNQAIKDLVAKFSPSIKAQSSYEKRSKLIQKLMTRGYTYKDIKDVLNSESEA